MRFDHVTYLVFGVAAMCLFLTVLAAGAGANDDDLPQPQPVSAVTEGVDPIKDVITRQLEAIRVRNADRAYALISDEMHEKFPSAKSFLSNMRFEFRPIYNNKSVSFLDRHNISSGAVQKVEMTDRHGIPVTVFYRLEKQDSGEWLIDSFTILESEADPI